MVYLSGLLCFIGFVVFEWLFPFDVLAWGPGVHTVAALGCLHDLSALSPVIAGVISHHPMEFLYGSLAADFFTGKNRKRLEEHPHSWAGGLNLLKGARDERDVAHVFGFLSHLAADVVAHNFFVPTLLEKHHPKNRMGHLYWELKADYMVGPHFTRIAREVLRMEHMECDALLKSVAGRRKSGFRTKKRLYTQSVRISNYIYGNNSVPLERDGIRSRTFYAHLVVMVDLSCRMVRDFLAHPGESLCLNYDPMGKTRAARPRKHPLPRVRANRAPGGYTLPSIPKSPQI